jgi:hypothetical protein
MEWFEQGPIFGARDSGLARRRFHAARCDEVLEKRGFKKLRRPRFEVAENPTFGESAAIADELAILLLTIGPFPSK